MRIVLKMQLFLKYVSDNQFDSGKMPLGLFHLGFWPSSFECTNYFYY